MLLILSLGTVGGFASAESASLDLSRLNADLTTLFTGVGQDLLPQVADLAMSGRPAVGAAELKGLYIALPSVSVSTGSGIGTVLHSDSSTWKFTLLPIPSLLSSAMSKSETSALVYDLVTAKSSPLPAIRFGAGLPLGHGLEILADGLVIPNALVSSAIDLAETDKSGTIHSLKTSFDLYSASATLRYVLLPEAKRSIRPAVSLGLEYSYLHLGLAVNGFSLSSLMKGSTILNLEGMGTLDMNGTMSLATDVHTAGLVLACSKTLGILRPFANVAFRYCNVRYSSDLEATATITATGSSTPAITATISSPVTLSDSGVKMVAAGGFEFVLPLFVLSTSLGVDFSTLKLNLTDIKSSAFKLAGVAANLTLRLQF